VIKEVDLKKGFPVRISILGKEFEYKGEFPVPEGLGIV